MAPAPLDRCVHALLCSGYSFYPLWRLNAMTTLTFECGSQNKEPVTISSEWFQITYTLIRNSDGEDVAYLMPNHMWQIANSKEEYSDIII